MFIKSMEFGVSQIATMQGSLGSEWFKRALALVILLSVLSLIGCSKPDETTARSSKDRAVAQPTADEVDKALQRAAEKSIGDREGAVLVMDPATGRLRAVVNQQIAFNEAFPPGSSIKPFTTLAALRSGVIDSQYKIKCQGRYSSGSFEIVCSHPRSDAPLDVVHALAYSCNFFFATASERLPASAFESLLASYGFGRKTGVSASESAGRIPAGTLASGSALGEGDQILVTPIQLIRGYVALISGRLLRPYTGASSSRVDDAGYLRLNSTERQILVKGMRGAVSYGTAASAQLGSVPMFVYGKTGTSASSNGFRTQGWFVAMAAPAQDADPTLAVLVFLRRSHGSECADVVRPILQEYSRLTTGSESAKAASDSSSRVKQDGESIVQGYSSPPMTPTESADLLPVSTADSRRISVHLVSKNKTESLSLEDYVKGVLRGEAGAETELEALKAQAVISRTYALKNLARHSREGFDFCSTTHCQRFVDRGSNSSLEQRVDAAVKETAGQVLVDTDGRLIDAYYSASCGGMTADIGDLWGVSAPRYLKGVSDSFCISMPHAHWSQEVESDKLLQALQADPLTDPGSRLKNMKVVHKDRSGRVEWLEIEGTARKVVRGWDFKLIVGRTLGWNILKSSRFTVKKKGDSYIFDGSGFGHGLGLCQEGSHVMASHGRNYRAILSHYFHGTSISSERSSRAELAHPEDGNPLSSESKDGRLIPASFITTTSAYLRADNPGVLRSEHFVVRYSSVDADSDARHVLDVLEAARRDLNGRLAAAAITANLPAPLQVVLNDSTQSFMAATGLPWWAAAATRGQKIGLQPVRVLRKRGILEPTLRHEYAHFVIERVSHGRAPRWLEEGLSAYVAGEGKLLGTAKIALKLSPEEISRQLASETSRERMKELYAQAYLQILNIISRDGESAAWKLVQTYGRA